MSYPPPLPPPVPYSMPGVPYGGPPASVKAIGIVGVVLASLTLVNHVLGVLLFTKVPAAAGPYGATFRAFEIVNSVVFGSAAVVLLAGSVGCLMRAEWGRVTLLGYAVGYSVLTLAATAVMVAWVVPSLMAPHLSGPQGQVKIAGAYGGAAFAGLAVLVLPAFILAYLRRPYVRAAFTR